MSKKTSSSSSSNNNKSKAPKSGNGQSSSPPTTPTSASSSPTLEAQLRCAFAMLDANGDGRVNAEELKSMLDRMGIAVDEATAKILVGDATKNGNGLISESEFLRWMSRLTIGSDSPPPDGGHSSAGNADQDDIEQDLRAAFNVFDRDRNGFITRDELKLAMQMIGESLTDQDIDDLLRATGLDRSNGKISYEDFVKILL